MAVGGNHIDFHILSLQSSIKRGHWLPKKNVQGTAAKRWDTHYYGLQVSTIIIIVIIDPQAARYLQRFESWKWRAGISV